MALRAVRALVATVVCVALEAAVMSPVRAQDNGDELFGVRVPTKRVRGVGNVQRQRDAFRPLCLTIHSASAPSFINPRIFNHFIEASNECRRTIRLRVCYFETDHCIRMTILGMSNETAILGSYPEIAYFRFSYEELNCDRRPCPSCGRPRLPRDCQDRDASP